MPLNLRYSRPSNRSIILLERMFDFNFPVNKRIFQILEILIGLLFDMTELT